MERSRSRASWAGEVALRSRFRSDAPKPFRALEADTLAELSGERLQLVEGELDWSAVSLPGIKIRKGLNRLGGNGLLYFKLLVSFVSLQRQGQETLSAALERADTAAVRLQAHTLKGVAKTLGADTLHALAERVELAAEAGERARLAAVLPPMRDELQQVLEGVTAFLEGWHLADERREEREPPSLDPQQAAERYALIVTLLEQGDTRLRDVCADNRAYVRDWFVSEVSGYESFMALIEQYRFEEARRIFRRHTMPPAGSEPLEITVKTATADRQTSA
jgi:two-component system, sensor histidine kinase and response regulator